MPASKKIERTVKEALKVKIEYWTPHGPKFNKLNFDGMVGYGWAVPSANDANIE